MNANCALKNPLDLAESNGFERREDRKENDSTPTGNI